MLVKKEPHTMPGTEWPLDKTIPSFHKEPPLSHPVPSAKAGAQGPGHTGPALRAEAGSVLTVGGAREITLRENSVAGRHRHSQSPQEQLGSRQSQSSLSSR